jgi:hypothetical protein
MHRPARRGAPGLPGGTLRGRGTPAPQVGVAGSRRRSRLAGSEQRVCHPWGGGRRGTPMQREETPWNGIARPSASSERSGPQPPVKLTRGQRGQPPTPAEVGRAAALWVLDQQTEAPIARELGIGRRTLARGKQRPEVVAAVTALQVWQALHAASPRYMTPDDRPETAYP